MCFFFYGDDLASTGVGQSRVACRVETRKTFTLNLDANNASYRPVAVAA